MCPCVIVEILCIGDIIASSEWIRDMYAYVYVDDMDIMVYLLCDHSVSVDPRVNLNIDYISMIYICIYHIPQCICH